MEILSMKELTAKKTHTCDLCKAEIRAGESYIRTAIVDAGKLISFKEHIHCNALAERYCMATCREEYDGEDVCCWAEDEVCTECENRDSCEQPTLECPKLIRALLPATIITNESVRAHVEENRTHFGKGDAR